jgi:hypothetical protein
VLIATLCGVPAVAVIDAGGAERFVKLKLAGPIVPAFAATVYGPPAVLFAVNVGAVATPLALVVTVAVPLPPANVPLAPFVAAVTVNVTETPLTPFPPLSATVACKEANAVLIATLCEPPLVAAMAAAAPALLVRENAAPVVTPLTVAFTV